MLRTEKEQVEDRWNAFFYFTEGSEITLVGVKESPALDKTGNKIVELGLDFNVPIHGTTWRYLWIPFHRNRFIAGRFKLTRDTYWDWNGTNTHGRPTRGYKRQAYVPLGSVIL